MNGLKAQGILSVLEKSDMLFGLSPISSFGVWCFTFKKLTVQRLANGFIIRGTETMHLTVKINPPTIPHYRNYQLKLLQVVCHTNMPYFCQLYYQAWHLLIKESNERFEPLLNFGVTLLKAC